MIIDAPFCLILCHQIVCDLTDKKIVMKKISLFLLCFIALHASAQEFHFMPKVGLNLANATNTEMGTRAGLNVGVGAEVMLSSVFALESGVYYSMQGARQKIGGLNEELEGAVVKLNLDYINIPVYAKGYVYKGLHIFGGPQLGFNIKAKGGLFMNRSSVMGDMKESFKPIDVSLALGVGYQFDPGFFFSMNYNIGLPGMMKYRVVIEVDGVVTDLDISGKYNAHNSVFQLNAGWRF